MMESTLLHKAGLLADRIFAEGETLPRNYVTHLTMEALLELSDVSDDPRYRDWVIQRLKAWGRKPEDPIAWRREPFENLSYILVRETGSAAARASFLEENRKLIQDGPRNANGAILHCHLDEPGRLLIDRLQAYVIRMAQHAALTGEPRFAGEAVRQHELYRAALRDPRTGLWSQGRGWAGPPEGMLSPGAWSRGHGWVIRGMVISLEFLEPESDTHHRLSGILREFADALLAVQDTEGMWHALLDQPWQDSVPETSGSGMICGYLLRAVRRGLLPADPYGAAGNKALARIVDYLDADGRVLSACPGPGPNRSIEGYFQTEFNPNEHHGGFGMLVALSEGLRAKG